MKQSSQEKIQQKEKEAQELRQAVFSLTVRAHTLQDFSFLFVYRTSGTLENILKASVCCSASSPSVQLGLQLRRATPCSPNSFAPWS